MGKIGKKLLWRLSHRVRLPCPYISLNFYPKKMQDCDKKTALEEEKNMFRAKKLPKPWKFYTSAAGDAGASLNVCKEGYPVYFCSAGATSKETSRAKSHRD